MRTKYYVLIIFCCGMLFGQTSSIQDNFLSSPSAASLPSYVKSPISISSGIPDTQIPFFGLATHNKGIKINTGMSYHPNNSGRSSKASDLGLGWSSYGITNLIYQEVNYYTNMPEGDFYYSVLGRSGKFSLSDDSSGNISIRKITNDKLKITVTKINGTYNFKIVDPMGTSYYFDQTDTLSRVSLIPVRTYSTAYYLSKVVDINNIEVLRYEYQEDAYTDSPPAYPSLTYPVKSLKVKRIISPDFGEINLNYLVDASKRKSYSDASQLTSIELKTTSGKVIEKYAFLSSMQGFAYPYGFIPDTINPCSYFESQEKRMLNKVLKYNREGTAYQITEFTYNVSNILFPDVWSDAYTPTQPCFANEGENPKYTAAGLLTSVKFPTGTTVKYDYELNQYFLNKNTTEYIDLYAPPYEVKDRESQYYENVAILTFDTNSTSTVFFTLPANPDNTEGSSYLRYWVNVDEYYPNPLLGQNESPVINVDIPGVATTGGRKKNMAGLNHAAITGTGGKGSIVIERVRYKSMPLANYVTGKGVRIKKIEYYDGNTLVSTQTKNYEYQKFSDNTQPSGVLNEFDNVGVVYKNVKETIGQGNGYTKYYFKTLWDYPENLSTINGSLLYLDELNYYDVLMNGIVEKTEMYKEDNTLVSSEAHDYEYYQTTPATDQKSSMIKKNITTVINNAGGQSLTVNSESQFDTKDQNLIYTKTTQSDGTINEQNITYPWTYQLIDPRLWNAGFIAVPLVVETKRNGTTISKSETKYENTSNFYPTGQVSYLPDDLSQSVKDVSYDIYDDKGNPVQYTVFPEVGSTGVSTTIIYGYNKTLPIAKIEGAKLSDIPASIITAIVNASNEDANASAAQEEAKELALIDALNSFRIDGALQNFMVTCYTYNPLIGITTTIPPNGIMELYKYDAYNRLLKTVDVNGNTIKEYQYNYKQ